MVNSDDDQSLESHQKTLRGLLPNINGSESRLFDAVPCFLVKDKNQVAGTLYVRETDIIFVANVFGVDIQINHRFKEISSLYSTRNSYFSSIIVEIDNDQKMDFKIDLEKEEKLMHMLNNIWANEFSESPIPTLELVKQISLGRSLESNESGGSLKLKEKKAAYKLPPEVAEPLEATKCECPVHLEVTHVDAEVHVPAYVLFSLMFGENSSAFWEKVGSLNGLSNRKEGNWSAEPVPTRDIEYDVPINNPMYKHKIARVIGKAHINKKKEHLVYVIEEFMKTPAVPYGDTFQTVARYCITWRSHETCHLLITGGIEWLKNPLVKGLIKAAAMKGLSETAKATLEIIENGLLSQPKMLTRETHSKQKPELRGSRFLSIQYNHLALLISLVIILVSLTFYNGYQINHQISTKNHCISEFSLNQWIMSDITHQIQKSNFIEYNFINDTINPNVTYRSSELRKNFKKYSKNIAKSKKMASNMMEDWILLNQIHESSIEALYQNWILHTLSDR